MGSFKPPKLPAGLPPETRIALDDAFLRLYSDLRAIERSEGTVEIRTASYRPLPGESVRVSPPAAGMAILLPAPDASNRGSQISLHIEHPDGAVRVFVAPNESNDATVNGQEMVSFDAEGLVIFESNGANRWQSIDAFSSASPGAAALDAEYVLGAAHASLPNGRVATDSTEIDADLTVANVISWALRTASVAFSKLANLAGLSVLGRAANSSGVMAAITATAGSQSLQSNAAGTALVWASILSAQFDDTVSGTLDPYLLPAAFKSGDSLVWVITGNVTLNRIRMSDDSVPPDGMVLFLSLRDQSGGSAPGFSITIVDTGAVTTNGSFRTPGQVQGTSPGPSYVMQSEEEGCILVMRAGNWRLLGGTAAQAIDGDITVSSGNGSTRTAAITTGVIVNADINASAAIALSKLATQAANSVVANATAGSAVPTAVAVGTNTVLGRVGGNIVAAALVNAQVDAAAAIALSKLATQAADSFVGNFTAGVAVPTARAGSSIAGTGLTYTTGGTLSVTVPLSDGDKGDITVASSGTSWTVDANTITPAKLAVLASNIAPVVAVFFSIAAGAGGAADDVTLFSSAIPHNLRWIEWRPIITTAVALATVEVRSASGGGGSALSSVFVAATAGEAAISASWTATATSASGTSAFLRRSDSGVALDLVGYYVKT